MRSIFGLVVVLVFVSAQPVFSQFPDQDGTGQPPTAQNPPVGNLNLQEVDRNSQPFEGEIPNIAPHSTSEVNGDVVYKLKSGSGSPCFGYSYEFGSFNIFGTSGEGLFTMMSQGAFPNNQRKNNLYRATLSYYGRYRDPNTGITGYLYYSDLSDPINERRYFLFGDRNIALDQLSDGWRHIVYYNKDGSPRFYARARFFKP